MTGLGGYLIRNSNGIWSRMDSGTTQPLRSIHGTSDSSICAAGDNGTLLWYDGSEWELTESPMRGSMT